MAKMIVTNLRMPEENYLAVRSLAATQGLSVNEYLKRMIIESVTRENLGLERDQKTSGKRKYTVWDLGDLARRVKRQSLGELSEDDKTIYGE